MYEQDLCQVIVESENMFARRDGTHIAPRRGWVTQSLWSLPRVQIIMSFTIIGQILGGKNGDSRISFVRINIRFVKTSKGFAKKAEIPFTFYQYF